MDKQFSIECANCKYKQPYTELIFACPKCGGEWLDMRYDLPTVKAIWARELRFRDPDMWRYWEVLPLLDKHNIVSMGEGWTPLLKAEHLGSMLGQKHIFLKDERQGPTASFKDRQASLAISVLKEANIPELVVASTGNVAISYSAYCARAGLKLWAFLDSQVPVEKMREVTFYSTEVIKVSSTYDRTKQIAGKFAKYQNIFLDKGVKGIAAREAMKTLGLEVAEQLGRIRSRERGEYPTGMQWQAPDWYIQAVSGGMGPIGVWSGFKELYDMGLIHRIPKLGIVQTEGCAPMTNSFEKGLAVCEIVENPSSVINVLATGDPGPAYPYLRDLVLRYGGAFVKVSDSEALRAMRVMAQLEGLSMEPAAAVACAGVIKMVQERLILADETVVINVSGHTFPVEKQILENEIVKNNISVQNIEQHEAEEHADHKPEAKSIPQEGLFSALQRLDSRVKSIAIIEDEPDARILLRRILQHRRKYNIFEAPDGASGIALIRKEIPDLVLLDLMMPGIDGFTILDIMKADEKLRNIPVIVITAKDLTTEDHRRLSGRIESLLQKGEFMEEELHDSINEVLS